MQILNAIITLTDVSLARANADETLAVHEAAAQAFDFLSKCRSKTDPAHVMARSRADKAFAVVAALRRANEAQLEFRALLTTEGAQ